MSDAWGQIEMRELCIITAAAAGGHIFHVRGEECAFLVRDVQGIVPDIAVPVTLGAGLRELVSSLHPASVAFQCSDAERPAMLALVEDLRRDRRFIEARH